MVTNDLSNKELLERVLRLEQHVLDLPPSETGFTLADGEGTTLESQFYDYVQDHPPKTADTGDRWLDTANATIHVSDGQSWTTLYDVGGGKYVGQVDLDGTDIVDGATTIYDTTAEQVLTGITLTADLNLEGNDITDGDGNVVYDNANNHTPTPRLQQGEGTGLDADLFRGTDLDTDYVSENAAGQVSAGDANIFYATSLADGESLEVYQATLATQTVSAVPTGVDLVISTFDNAGGSSRQSVSLSGDGTTVFDNETGTPLDAYTNTSGGAQSVGVLVDNGHYNSGSGADQQVQTGIHARMVQ